jgi:hypothetical protein
MKVDLELCQVAGVLLALLNSRVLPPQVYHLSLEEDSRISPTILYKFWLSMQRYATEKKLHLKCISISL